MTELQKMLIDAGYPESEMFHHYSDLYIFVTPVSKKVVEAWCKKHGFAKYWHCPTFKDQITGRLMYDCAFCYAE